LQQIEAFHTLLRVSESNRDLIKDGGFTPNRQLAP